MMNEDFYQLILPHISSIPDLRPQETLKKMSDKLVSQNTWRILAEELEGLLSISGEEEDEERELWLILSNGENVIAYIDDKREITDRFINKYLIIFLLILRAIPHDTSLLLFSCREEMLNMYPFLEDEMNKYRIRYFFLRSRKLAEKWIHEPIPSYNEVKIHHPYHASSLLTHFLLYRTHMMTYRDMFVNRFFGPPSSFSALDARLSLVEIYQEDMTITEMAVCYISITIDLIWETETSINEELLLYLVSDDIYQGILRDPRAVSINKRDFAIPYIKSNRIYLSITENDIFAYRSEITPNIIFLGNYEILIYYWPIVISHDLKNMRHFKYSIVDAIYSDKNKERISMIAKSFAFILYNLEHSKPIWELIMGFSTGYSSPIYDDSDPTTISLVREILPLLSDEHVIILYNKAQEMKKWTGEKWRQSHLLIKDELNKRNQ